MGTCFVAIGSGVLLPSLGGTWAQDPYSSGHFPTTLTHTGKGADIGGVMGHLSFATHPCRTCTWAKQPRPSQCTSSRLPSIAQASGASHNPGRPPWWNGLWRCVRGAQREAFLRRYPTSGDLIFVKPTVKALGEHVCREVEREGWRSFLTLANWYADRRKVWGSMCKL